MEIKIGSHREYLNELVGLFATVFGKISMECWQWKHLHSPSWENEEPTLVLCFDSGQIVGANGFMPTKFRSPFGDIKAMQSCESMIHPLYRGKNIFTNMLKHAELFFSNQGFHFLYGFPSDVSQQGLLRAGWNVVMTPCEYVKIISIKQLAKHAICSAINQNVSGPENEPVFNMKEYDPGIKIEMYNSYPDILDQTDKLYSSNNIELLRDQKYLKWRIDQKPHGRYKYAVLSKKNELYGYLILSINISKFGLRYGAIIDYRILSTHVNRESNFLFMIDLIDSAIKWFSQRKCCLVLFWGSKAANLERAFNFYNFRSVDRFPFNLKKRFACPLLIKPLSKDMEHVSLYMNSTSWDVTSLYTDTA